MDDVSVTEGVIVFVIDGVIEAVTLGVTELVGV